MRFAVLKDHCGKRFGSRARLEPVGEASLVRRVQEGKGLAGGVAVGTRKESAEGYWGGRGRERSGKEEVTEDLIH